MSLRCFQPSFKSIDLSDGEKKQKQTYKMAAKVAILDFWSECFSSFLINKSPWCFLPSFKSTDFSFQEKKWKIYFQDDHHGSHLGFPTGTILAVFDLQVTWCFLPSFKSIGLSDQEKKQIIDFRDGSRGHLGFPIRTILAISDLHVSSMLPTKFQVNWLRGSGGADIKEIVDDRHIVTTIAQLEHFVLRFMWAENITFLSFGLSTLAIF